MFTKQKMHKINGYVCGTVTLLGYIILVVLSIPYFFASVEKDGQIMNDYWKSNYFNEGFGYALMGLLFASVLGTIATVLCFREAKKGGNNQGTKKIVIT